MQFNERIPIYMQLIELFEERIASGYYKAGEVLPSRREMAREFGINPNTVQRAFKEMEQLGWIVSDNRVQSMITEDSDFLSQIRKKHLKSIVKETIETVQTLQLTQEEFEQLVQELWSEVKEQADD